MVVGWWDVGAWKYDILSEVRGNPWWTTEKKGEEVESIVDKKRRTTDLAKIGRLEMEEQWSF